MKYKGILSRAFHIAIHYRALWIFGFLLALCGGSGGSGSGNFDSSNFSDSGGFNDPFGGIDPQMLIAIGIGLLCLALILIIIGVIVRVVCTSAIIGMVNQIEETDEVTFKDGWRFGWSRSALRLFLIGLVIGIPVAIVVILILLAAASPFLLAVFNPDTPALVATGIILGIGLILLAILAIVVISLAVSALTELANRYAVLNAKRTIASIREGYQLIRRNLKEVSRAVLVLFGVGIGWAVLSIILLIVIGIIAAIIGGLPGLLVYWLTNEVWIALLVGLPLFIIAFIIPMTFASGIYLIFHSATWTLIFRNLIENEKPKALITDKSIDPRGQAINSGDADPDRCLAITKTGHQCKNRALLGSNYCRIHQ